MLKINDNDKILIVRLTALGDCVHTIPLAYSIKKEFPNAFVGWVVSEKCKDLIVNNPLVDKVYVLPKNDSKKYADILAEIRKEKYTIAIDTQELFKSAIVSFSSWAKYRLAHDNSREFSHLFANKRLKHVPLFDTSRHVIERNMDFAKYLGIEKPEISFAFPQNSLVDEEYINSKLDFVSPKQRTIVVAPSTTWVTKFWPKDNWVNVINDVAPHMNVVITGGNADKDYIDAILSQVDNKDVKNLAGQTNILQLKILFEKADIVLTPDSGSAHLAAALNSPVVMCLCGSTSPIRNGAYGKQHINLSSNLNCQYCYKKHCKFADGIPECMVNISSDLVIEKIKSVLRQ